MSRLRYENLRPTALRKVQELIGLSSLVISLTVLLLTSAATTQAQLSSSSITHKVYGDLKIDESKMNEDKSMKPLSFDVILYTLDGRVVARDKVAPNGRYTFMEVRNGEYNLVVQWAYTEVGRIRLYINLPGKTDYRQDIQLEWSTLLPNKKPKPGVVAAADFYPRNSLNKERFEKAEADIGKKNYEQALPILLQVVGDDPKDYQALTELGTVYYFLKKPDEAEKSYRRALELQPNFFVTLLSLGRLRLEERNLDGAIEVLEKALKARPESPAVNYFLGEAYLQNHIGSKAINHFTEALKLDPQGMAEAHLRIAAIYDAMGQKEKAAAEVEQFLKKRPDYPDKEKFKQYVKENKKP